MGTFAKYKVIHNGSNIDWLDSEEQIERYIQSTILSNPGIDIAKIMDKTLELGGAKVLRIVRYQYKTLYEEVFLIEYEA